MGLLRLMLALNVVLFHAASVSGNWYPMHGVSAVWMFYAISGFYMALVLNEKYPPGQNRLFWSNRFWRLAPGYGVSLVLIGLFIVLSGRLCNGRDCVPFGDLAALKQVLPGPMLIAAIFPNLFILGSDIMGMLTLGEGRQIVFSFTVSEPGDLLFTMLNPPAHTLSGEILFYAMAPFLVRSRRRLWVALALAAVYHATVYASGYYVFSLYYVFSPSTLIFFFAGALAYHYRAVWDRAGWPLPGAAGALLFGLSTMMLPLYVTGFLCVLGLLLVLPPLFRLTQSSRVDRLVGEFSYPVYILHWPILGGIALSFGQADYAVLGTLVLTLPAAALTFWLVDRPVDRWRQRRVAQLLGGGRHG